MPTLEPYVYKDENGNYYINGSKVQDFYYSPGDPNKQGFILKQMIALGGINKYGLTIDEKSSIYYIDVNSNIIYKTSNTSQMGILLTLYGTLVESPEIKLSTTWEEHYTKFGYSKDPLSSLWTSISSEMTDYSTNTDERNYYDSYISFIKLTYLRDEYRMEWLPDVSKEGSIWAVVYNDNELQVIRRNCSLNSHFSFQSEEIANLFITYFSEDLYIAKYLMGYEDVICNVSIKKYESTTITLLDSEYKDITSNVTDKGMYYNTKFYIKVKYNPKKIEKPEVVIINEKEFQLADKDGYLITDLLTNKLSRGEDMNISIIEIPIE